MAENTDARIQLSGLDRSYVNARLNAWGRWMERHVDDNSYPRFDNVTAFLQGAGGGKKGDRILCIDMPESIGKTHVRVLYALEEAERYAVFLWFVIHLKPDGTEWSMQEKCHKFGTNPDTLRWRLNRARYQFLGIVPPY